MSAVIVHPSGARLTLDATLVEDYAPRVAASVHPIEPGVTDNTQRLPTTFSIQGIVTESPFQGAPGPFTGVDRPLDALAFLESCVGELLTVITSRYGSISPVLLIGWPHRVDINRHLPITLEFQTVAVAQLQTVFIPPERPRVEVAATLADEQDLGNRQTETNRDARADAEQSAAVRLLSWIGG